jgi:hypothetical protein
MDNRVRSFWLAVLVAVLAGTGILSSSMFFAAAVAGFIAYREGWLCGLFVGMVALATNPTLLTLIRNRGFPSELPYDVTTYTVFRHFVLYAHVVCLLPTTALGGYCGATFRVRVWSAAGPRAWRRDP